MRFRVPFVVIWGAPAPGGAAVTACALAVLAIGSSRKPNFFACLAFPDHVNRCYLPLAVLGTAMGPPMRLYLLYGCLDHSGTVSRSYALPYERMHRARQAATPAGMHTETPLTESNRRKCATGHGKKAAWSRLYYSHLTRCRDRARNQCLRSASLPGLTRNIRRRCAGGTDVAADWTGHTKRKRHSRSL